MDASNEPLKGGEKWFGYIVMACLAAGGVYAASFLLPVLAGIAWSAVSLGVASSILVVAGLILSDEKFRRMISMIFRTVVRGMTRAVIAYDPIGALKDVVAEMRGKLGEIDKQRQKLMAADKDLAESLARSKAEYKESMSKAAAAKKLADSGDEGATRVLMLEGRKAERRKGMIEKQEGMKAKFTAVGTILTKVRGKAEFVILDTEDEVAMIIAETTLANTAGASLETALDLLGRDPELRSRYTETLEIAKDKISERLGMVEMFIKDSDSLVASINVEDAMWEERTLAALEQRGAEIDNFETKSERKRAVVVPQIAESVGGRPVLTAIYEEPVKKNL